jgi:hypothetical protein
VALACSDSPPGRIAATAADAAVSVDASPPDAPPPDARPACTKLFGQPTENTGLGPESCGGDCPCTGHVPTTFTDAEVEALKDRVLLNPPAPLPDDPYQTPELYPDQADRFCGVVPGDGLSYTLVSYDSIAALEVAGATLTHHGACGRCSSLEDLAVYVSRGDLAGPVRGCGIGGFIANQEQSIACLRLLGFTAACAEIWFHNTEATRSRCLEECLGNLDADYHLPDGSLNPCIQCDEDQAGAIFKAVAGRSRRRSGLPSALCRPCQTVAPVTHSY